ncbi:MAG: hypothetical protein Q9174_002393, partial [Haloplaca sp. 1 TL-2023]
MTSNLLPPNPCLVGILLVAKARNSDAGIVFHYPPRPGEDNSKFTRYLAAQDRDRDGSSSTDDDSTSSHEDEVANNIKTKDSQPGVNTPELDIEETGSISPEKNSILQSQSAKPRWNDVFGLSSYGLARLLAPPPTSHKKRFELSIDDKVFVGCPIFAQEGDLWQKKKLERKTKARQSRSGTETSLPQELGSSTDALDDDEQPSKASGRLQANKAVEGEALSIAESSQPDVGDTKPKKKNRLYMFHIVFVLNPPPLEYQVRVKEIYDHVVKKLSKALKLEQARSNYVMRQISTLSTANKEMKKATGELDRSNCARNIDIKKGADQSLAPLYHHYISQSPLARAISIIYDCISTSRIALINLTPSSFLPLQLPFPTCISILPGPLSPQLPGLWLTTATSLPPDSENEPSHLASHFTLLLLSDLPSILHDLNATRSSLTEPLTHYLRLSRPTKSFHQISQSSGIPLQDIQYLASHLIYWRKARAVPPLHQRDTYIVSPNADMSKLISATRTFGKSFSALPSLPQILALLSATGGPRSWKSVVPSKDHKEVYMEILAWLCREGWVTQLRTFAWVRVPGFIKSLVDTQDAERSLESSIELPPPSRSNRLGIPQPSSSPT